jgi:hypothetical protein
VRPVDGVPFRAVIAARSSAFGLITIGLTLLAHAAAGGATPAPAALAVLVVVTGAAGMPLLRRRLRPAMLARALGAAQALLPPVFEALAGIDPAGHAGHGTSPLMLGAHVSAGVLAVLVVTALDPALGCLGVRGARLRVRPAVVRTAPVTQDPPRPRADLTVPTPRVLARPAPRRGPPLRPALR